MPIEGWGSLSEELASRPHPRRRWARWFVPDLALSLAWVTLFYSLILFHGTEQFFRDSDSGWHILTGERILTSSTLPQSDPYSFSRAGEPWLDWEWGSDVLMGAVHQWSGLAGVVWLYALALAAVSWLWIRLNWAAGGNFFFAGALAMPMLSTTNLHWLARPHVLGWICLLCALCLFETAPPRFRWRDGVLVGALSVCWVNLHASFFLMPLIALVYSAGHLIGPLVWKLDTETERRRARWYGIGAGVAFAASLANPYGLRLHLHVIQYLSDSQLLDHVGEFQSFDFHVAGAWQILAMAGLAAAGGVLAIGQKKLTHFLLTAMFLGIAFRSARGLPVAALVLLPLANGSITESLRRVRELRPVLRRFVRGFLQYSDRLRLLDARLSGFVWIPVTAVLVIAWLRIPSVAADVGFSPQDFPVNAAGELTLLPPGARLLAPDKYGGYLIYRFKGQFKVFFDGRSDFYGAGFMKNYLRLVEVRPGWRQRLEAMEFTHALLPVDYSLVPALEGIGWTERYRDDYAVLLQRPAQAARE